MNLRIMLAFVVSLAATGFAAGSLYAQGPGDAAASLSDASVPLPLRDAAVAKASSLDATVAPPRAVAPSDAGVARQPSTDDTPRAAPQTRDAGLPSAAPPTVDSEQGAGPPGASRPPAHSSPPPAASPVDSAQGASPPPAASSVDSAQGTSPPPAAPPVDSVSGAGRTPVGSAREPSPLSGAPVDSAREASSPSAAPPRVDVAPDAGATALAPPPPLDPSGAPATQVAPVDAAPAAGVKPKPPLLLRAPVEDEVAEGEPPPMLRAPEPSPPPRGKSAATRVWQDTGEAVAELFPARELESIGDILFAVFLVLFAFAVSRTAATLRRHLGEKGLIPSAVVFVHRAARVAVVIFGILLLSIAAPHFMGPALPWMLLAAAAAVGWSARDLLPDLIAGMVVIVERKIRPGTWVSGAGFAGVVLRVGPRSTLLRDESERRVAVPNRALLNAPVVSDSAKWPTHETTVRFPEETAADLIRIVLSDAILSSPWTPIETGLVLRRDSEDSARWHVRVRLLDLRFAARFDGELLERAEAMLAHRLTSGGSTTALPAPLRTEIPRAEGRSTL